MRSCDGTPAVGELITWRTSAWSPRTSPAEVPMRSRNAGVAVADVVAGAGAVGAAVGGRGARWAPPRAQSAWGWAKRSRSPQVMRYTKAGSRPRPAGDA